MAKLFEIPGNIYELQKIEMGSRKSYFHDFTFLPFVAWMRGMCTEKIRTLSQLETRKKVILEKLRY